MKINNQNVEERKSWVTSNEPNENGIKQLPFALAENDVHAVNSARSHYNFTGIEETIKRLIEDRHQITELTLSKTGRHMNHGTLYFESEEAEQIVSEANQLGLNVGEYIRGIIYTRSNQLMQEQMEKREAEEKRIHDNRVLNFKFDVSKELRGKLYKKYGQLNDKDLEKAVVSDVLKQFGK